jgi:hypothetical protein
MLAAALGALVIVVVLEAVHLDPLRLVSGVYRSGNLPVRGESQVIYYHDGRTATVSVRLQPDGSQTLSTNGKPDASLSRARLYPDTTRPPEPFSGDESTQLLLGIVALAHAPHARQAAVIGMGSGMTSHLLLGARSLRRVVTIEIEPDMIDAARLFRPANQRVFDDRRSHFVIDDARSYFAASRERFDLIVSEPSNPWVSGVSGLFTDEFYARIKSSLTPDGVLAQWLHLYSLDDDLALNVLAALHRHFRDFHIHMVSRADCLILATDREGSLHPDWSVTREPGIAADLRHAPSIAAHELDATWVADRVTLAPLLDRSLTNSDFVPRLDLGAERARFQNQMAVGMLRFHADRFGLPAIAAPRVEAVMGPVALAPVPRLQGLLENSRLRATLAGHPAVVDTAEARRIFAAAERLDRVLRPRDRTDPHAWLADVVRAEDDLHRGTSGWADEGFYSRVRTLARLGRAPTPVAQTIEWLHALEVHDYARASALTDSLLAASAAGHRAWIEPSLLFDGGLTAKLAIGDVAGAGRIAKAFGVGAEPESDLRTRLIQAWLSGSR